MMVSGINYLRFWPMSKVELKNYEGREQAFIKHSLLGSYLPELGFKVGRKWESLLYIDTHAGPWKGNDESLRDTSFSIGVDTLRRVLLGLREVHGHSIEVKAFLNELNNSEKDEFPFDRLNRFSEESSRGGVEVTASNQTFEDATPSIQAFIKSSPKSFRFILIDPKGWDSIPMSSIAAITNDRSSEVLVNLMTQDLRRFLEQIDREASYLRLFGREEALANVRKLPREQRVDGLVREYCKSLKQCCGFDHVSSCAILSPDRNDIKYFLVFGTNHHRGIEVFKDAESRANNLQESIKNEKLEQASNEKAGCDSLFAVAEFGSSPYLSELREKYREKAKAKLYEKFAEKAKIPYREVFCCTMAFPLFGKEDLHSLLEQEPRFEIELDRSERPNRIKPNCSESDFVILKDVEG